MTEPVFRFAPSPNGDLHLGHALSAILNHDAARAAGGRFLVRIEDIDAARSRPSFVARILEDLEWLGLAFERPVRRQSQHAGLYRDAIGALARRGLVYPSFATRTEIRAAAEAQRAAGEPVPVDPDGAPSLPPPDRGLDPDEAGRRMAAGEQHALRLAMDRAVALAGPLTFMETGDGVPGHQGVVAADPAVWGDVVLARKDAPASYHVAVVVDDALQGVSTVIRGADLFAATAVHRLLQRLLGLPEPVYRHHALVMGEDGRKLSKSAASTSLRALREAGMTPAGIRERLGLAPAP